MDEVKLDPVPYNDDLLMAIGSLYIVEFRVEVPGDPFTSGRGRILFIGPKSLGDNVPEVVFPVKVELDLPEKSLAFKSVRFVKLVRCSASDNESTVTQVIYIFRKLKDKKQIGRYFG